MRLLPAVAIAAGLTIVGAPGAANASPHIGLPTCPETSQVCPPDVNGYAQQYAWARPTTGAEVDQLFDGTSLPAGWFAQSVGTPGNCNTGCNDTWSTANTSVGGGVVSMTTTCSTPKYVSICTSGGIGQDDWAYATTAGEATAITARVTSAGSGTHWTSDQVLQMAQYCNHGVFNGTGCAWPPEIDFMENGTGSTSSFNAFLHCYSGPGQMDQIAQHKSVVTGFNVGGWATYEVDWYPTQILVYATEGGVTHLEANWLKSTTTNVAGYYDTACSSYWPPTPNAALGIFMQSQLIGSATPYAGTFGLQVDWIAQQPLA